MASGLCLPHVLTDRFRTVGPGTPASLRFSAPVRDTLQLGVAGSLGAHVSVLDIYGVRCSGFMGEVQLSSVRTASLGLFDGWTSSGVAIDTPALE